MINQENVDKENAVLRTTMAGHLGIKLYPSGMENIIKATMPVNERTCQPLGLLAGGASLALAEILAGHGSQLLCGADVKVVGIEVTGHHISSVPKGKIVTAIGEIIHKGQHTHLWNVDIYGENGKLASTVRVVNYIREK